MSLINSNSMKRYIITGWLFYLISSLNAQIDYSDFITSGEFDSYFKVAVRERTAIPYAPVREADIKYTKRVIRCIDVRQKKNKPMEWPRSSFSLNLMNALWEGAIVPYKNDSLSSFYNTDVFKSRCSYVINTTIAPYEDDPDYLVDTSYNETMDFNDIKKVWVMEEWNFNSETSIFTPRIIALAPIYKPKLSAGVVANDQPLCWIIYNQAVRERFARWELFNPHNDVRLNYDDWFQMRLFDSFIVFESNVFDLYVNEFQEYQDDNVAALLKADEIKNDLFVFEHDLWQF